MLRIRSASATSAVSVRFMLHPFNLFAVSILSAIFVHRSCSARYIRCFYSIYSVDNLVSIWFNNFPSGSSLLVGNDAFTISAPSALFELSILTLSTVPTVFLPCTSSRRRSTVLDLPGETDSSIVSALRVRSDPFLRSALSTPYTIFRDYTYAHAESPKSLPRTVYVSFGSFALSTARIEENQPRIPDNIVTYRGI